MDLPKEWFKEGDEPKPDLLRIGMYSQLVAMEIAVFALINTHPDPKALLEEYRALIAGLQVGAAQAGAPLTPETVRASFDRVLAQIEARVQQSS